MEGVLPEPAALFVGAAASGVLDVPVCMDVKRYCAGCLAGAQDNECLYTVLGGRICNTRSTRRNRRTGGCYYVPNEKWPYTGSGSACDGRASDQHSPWRSLWLFMGKMRIAFVGDV